MHKPGRLGSFRIVREDVRNAQAEHRYDEVETASHRKSVMRLLTAVHHINAREISSRAREFEGVM